MTNTPDKSETIPTPDEICERLNDEAMRLLGRGIDRGDVDSSLAGNLALEAADTIEALYGQLDAAQTDLDLLRLAIEADDPKAELLIRVTDLWKRNDKALSRARNGGQP